MVAFEEIALPFIVPAITGLIIFITQWHKKGAQIEVSGSDIVNIKKQMDGLDEKMNKLLDRINNLTTDTEVFRYRIKVLERLIDSAHGSGVDDREFRTPYRPKDSNGE